MKRLISAILLLPLISFAQNNTIDTARFNYTAVQSVDSSSSKILQSRARLFVTESFNSSKDVIQMDDADGGVIIVKAILVPVVSMGILGRKEVGIVHFILKLQFKDGKYKYTFSDFVHEGDGTDHMSHMIGGSLLNKKPDCGTMYLTMGYWRQIKEYTDRSVAELISKLSRTMTDTQISSKQDAF